jgi:predicted Zn-dependent peptidase
MKMMTREYFKQVYSLKDNDEIVEIINNVNCDKINEVAKRFQKKFSVILKEGN